MLVSVAAVRLKDNLSHHITQNAVVIKIETIFLLPHYCFYNFISYMAAL
jgi:hypothetical protein